MRQIYSKMTPMNIVQKKFKSQITLKKDQQHEALLLSFLLASIYCWMIELQVIWDVYKLIWRHSNGQCMHIGIHTTNAIPFSVFFVDIFYC